MTKIEKAIKEATNAISNIINRREYSAYEALEIAEGIIDEMDATIIALKDDIKRGEID